MCCEQLHEIDITTLERIDHIHPTLVARRQYCQGGVAMFGSQRAMI